MRRGDDWLALMVVLERGAARYGRRIVIYLGGKTTRRARAVITASSERFEDF